jgi:hypothetical protein
MKPNLISTASLALLFIMSPTAARADKLDMKDGSQLEGIVKKVAGGEVTVEVGNETKVFDILEVTSIDFDTPHLQPGTSKLLPRYFSADTEAQEIAMHLQSVNKSATEIRTLLEQIKRDWAGRTIEASQATEWNATREQFGQALSRYQETLDDFYIHVLDKVDTYNVVAKQGIDLYVGIKGVFNVGSPLVSGDMKQLPLKKFVPANWYDKIFYDGYWSGYRAGYTPYWPD